MGIKKIGVDTNYATYEELKQRHVVAQGWSEFGDLTFLLDQSEDIEEYLPRITYGSQGGKNTFKQLFRKINSGDIILALEGNQIKGIAEIPDKFTYCYDSKFDYSNSLFPVTWIDWDSFCKDVNLMSQGGQGAPGIVDCGLDNINGYINRNWGKFKRENNIDIQPKQCEKQLKALIENLDKRIKETKINYMKSLNNEKNSKKVEELVDILTHNHNLILTGAPGTGKTYLAKQMAQQMIFKTIKEKLNDKDKEDLLKEHCGFVQFHPSYDYTDFVEGLRPVQDDKDDNKNAGFERKDGVFKEFCKKAIEKNDSKAFDDAYDKLLIDIGEGQLHLKTKNGNQFAVSINSKSNLKLLTGTELKENGVLTRDRIKAEFKGENPYQYWKGYYRGVVEHLIKKYNIKIEGKKYINSPYVFIIDEINRGEISKIFGELFFSIDPGYRGKEKGKIKTQYQNLIEQGDVFYDGFYVPENVYIIGTMNDIDRSVESMDFAFRRRFAFKEIKATDRVEMLDDLTWKDEAVKRMNRLNAKIEIIEGLSSAYHIGPAYFLKLKNYNGDFDQLWENHLEGLLREYLRGMQNLEEKLKTLKAAYDNESDSDSGQQQE